jgi:hypothetical protein
MYALLLLTSGPPPTRQEMLEFVSSESLTAVFTNALTHYWPSLLMLVFCGACLVRFGTVGWLSVPLVALSLQQSLLLSDLLNWGGWHTHEFLHELWSAVAAAVLVVSASMLLVLMFRTDRPRRPELALIWVSLVAFATVLMDWVFLLFVATPVGGAT